jgi:hypothetical protein
MRREQQHSEPVQTAAVAVAFIAMLLLRSAEGLDISAGEGFATPQAAIAAYRQAVANKEWRTAFLCHSPASRGTILFEILFSTGMSNDPQLVAIVEKHLKGKFSNADTIIGSAVRHVDGRHVLDRKALYEGFIKRVSDVPGLVEEFCREGEKQGEAAFEDFIAELEAIKLDGDTAIALGRARPIPDPTYVPPPFDKPQSKVMRLCRIGGKWYLGLREENVPLPDPPQTGPLVR